MVLNAQTNHPSLRDQLKALKTEIQVRVTKKPRKPRPKNVNTKGTTSGRSSSVTPAKSNTPKGNT